jgi:hypothetical protein
VVSDPPSAMESGLQVPLFSTYMTSQRAMMHLSSDGDLDLDTGLDVDDDLLDDLSWCVKTIG